MPLFQAKLTAVDISYNYVEHGDTLYVTARWQNAGDGRYTGDAKIAVDLAFDMRQRHLENQTDGFRFTWTPRPELFEWKPGEAWSTTGAWKVPETWCGIFRMRVSLLAGDGEALPFIGKDGRTVYREDIADVDLGWGWGRKMLLATRKPIHVDVNPEAPAPAVPRETADARPLGGFLCHAGYPAVVGMGTARWNAEPPVLTVRSLQDGRLIRCLRDKDKPAFSLSSAEPGKIVYTVQGGYGSCDVVFEMDGPLLIRVENLRETAPYEWISLYFPQLLGVGSEGKLANFFCGGREAAVKDTLPVHAAFPYDVCNAMALYDGSMAAAVITDDTEAVLYQSVVQGGEKRGVVGAELVIRVASEKAGLSSISFPIQPLELHALASPSWEELARLMRARLPEGKGLYDKTLFYKIGADTFMQINPDNPATFAETMRYDGVRSIIEGIYHITGGMRQVVYLVGWQEYGHDTMYPYPHRHSMSPRIGTEEEWEETRQFARRHNAILSFHDNFDDALLSGELDYSLLAMDSRGGPQRGWLWAGGMTYVISPKVYVESGAARERVEKTISRFHIEDSYHLDVMTSEVRRYDFTPGRQSAARENIAYKRQIVECFNGFGVDITSETLAMPFVGSIGYALHSRYNFDEVLFPGELVIPLTTMMYHGITPYNMGAVSDSELLRAIAFGATGSIGIEKQGGFDERQTRCLYLHTMPMHLLIRHRVTSCCTEREHVVVRYENGSLVDVNFREQTYRIVLDGKTIAWDFRSCFPWDGGASYRLFSLADEELEVELPADWRWVELTVLSYSGEEPAGTAAVVNGKARIRVSACRPMRITPVTDSVL